MKLKYKILSIIPDSIYLKIKYFYFFKKKLDLTSPRNYNEKIQWLKLYDRKEQYTKMVDKYEAKDYVSNLIGNKYIIPTIEIYNKFEDIDFNKLPNQFVIKCTHDSGSVIIVDNKNSFNIIDAKKYINMRMKLNYYYMHREWPYKNIKPRIIIEKYMGNNIKDYKFFCFNGKPEIMYISEGSHTRKQYIAFYDMDYNRVPIGRKDYLNYKDNPKKPTKFEEMKKLASILSKDIPHVRVDFYEIDNSVYFGELTFYTGSGFIPFDDEKWNTFLGNMIQINDKKGRLL